MRPRPSIFASWTDARKISGQPARNWVDMESPVAGDSCSSNTSEAPLPLELAAQPGVDS
jgi:hypothetical protein